MKNIFLDVDETLVASEYGKHMEHAVEIEGCEGYFTVERPCAKRVIDLCRELAGASCVYLLSIGERDYIQCLNRMLGWDFDDGNIFGREDLEGAKMVTKLAYGSHVEVNPTIFAHKDNLLIDNLIPRHNELKIAFIGINSSYEENYFEVEDYFGSLEEAWDEEFFAKVSGFLKSR